MILVCVGAILSQEKVKARVHENHLRTKAISSFMPRFPKAAKKARSSGVAVAQIIVNEFGQVIDVQILEAPHPAIGDAVKEALYRWRFTPFSVKGQALKVRGKMTFYFVNDKRGTRVENPYPW